MRNKLRRGASVFAFFIFAEIILYMWQFATRCGGTSHSMILRERVYYEEQLSCISG